MSARVLVVILNWRTPDMTLRATEATLAAMEGVEGAVTVVDNDSGDGSFERMRDAVAARGWGRVRVLQSGRNGGFGAGNNAGIRAGLPDGRPDFVLVLNSDAFPRPDAIRALRDHLLAHPRAAFAGSCLVDETGTPQLSTFRFPTIPGQFEGAARTGPLTRLLARWVVPVPVPERSCRVDWLAGASLMMRMDALDEIGLFDERFFLYFEETDLCLRLARAGHEVHFVRDSVVMHIDSGTTGAKDWDEVPGYWYESRWHYFEKNHGRAYALAATAAQVAGGLLHRLRSLLAGRRPDEPRRFLRRLVAHDLRALFGPARTAAGPAPQAAGRISENN
ncbi:MAG: glycosyltransferase family 2 protein [Rubellimicrobium sp.]|nr:glycosyltransferase family 2 protein [Rubellimicrobium sp.]